ncbi:MAG: hypothetical protein ACOH19_10140 [Rhodoglobus sp.]
MEFASYLAGERWSDHPACTHATLAVLARDVNDLTSDTARQRLVPLIHRVVGLTGSSPAIASTIALRAAALALPIASMERQRALATGVITVLPEVSDQAVRSAAILALAQTPDAETWARGFLAAMGTSPHTDRRRNESIIHTAAVGIAQACVQEPQVRLAELLETVIGDVERLVDRGRLASRISDRAFASA